MRHAWATVAVSSLAAFQVAMTLSIVFVVFVELDDYFPDASTAELSWALNAFTIVGASTVVLGAAVADRWGHKRIALSGTGLFVLGSLIAGLARSVPVLIIGRCVQALGSSLFGPASLALILIALPVNRRGIGLGMFTMGGALAAATGPALGGVIVESFGWRWAFLVVVPFGLAALVVGSRVYVESDSERTTRLPDPFGAVLIMTGVGSVILALVQSDEWGWGDRRTLLAAATGFVLLGWLVFRSSRHPQPILDLTLYRLRRFRAGNISLALFALSFFTMLFVAILFLTEVWDFELSKAGILTAPLFLATGLTGPVAGRLVDAIGPRTVVVAGALLWTSTMATLSMALGETPNVGLWLLLIIIGGIGSGLFWASAPTLAVDGLDSTRFARASGMNQTFQSVGNAAAIALAIALLGDEPEFADFSTVFMIVIAAGALTATVAFTAGPRDRAAR